MINKLKKLFAIFDIHDSEIPLFLKDFNISYYDILDNEKFSKKIDDKLLDYIVKKLHVNIKWLYDNSNEIVKSNSNGFYKRAEFFCNEILSKYPSKLYILTQRIPDKDYDEKNDDNRIEIIAEYSFTLPHDKSIYSYEIFNSGCRWGYWRCRKELKKFLLCLKKHHFINHVEGRILVDDYTTKIGEFKKGNIAFSNIYKQNKIWYPEDYIESKNININAKEEDELVEILKELQEKDISKSVSKTKLLKKETDNYTLYENNEYNFTIENLAKSINKYLNTKFLLYREDNLLYTDNEYVLQIIKYEVDFLAINNEKIIIYDDKNNHIVFNDELSISTDYLIEEKDNVLKFKKIQHKVKWYYIYQKLYDLLYFYLKNTQEISVGQNVRKKTYGERIYQLLNTNDQFIKYNDWIEKFSDLKSIDPLHLFVSFNSANQKDKNRINRILQLYKVIDSNSGIGTSWHVHKLISDIKNYGIDFSGSPMPIATNILSARNKDDQEKIWDYFFELNNKNISINFSDIKNIYGLDVASFTIFMFWCNPLKYISLDKNIFLLLQNNNKLNDIPQTYDKYHELLAGDKRLLYVNLSKIAIDLKNQANLTKYEQEEIDNYFSSSKKIQELKKTNFELIAIKVLDGSNQQYSKNLAINKYYQFNNSYEIKDEKIIQDESIKNIHNLKNNITINAIVGKNGSGKSTIAEVLYGLIYNLSVYLEITNEMKNNKKIDLFVEIIFKHNKIYKLVCNNSLKVYVWQDEKWQEITNFNLNSFFYTIAINYSIYANNSKQMGDWIDKIFHKNDAYQTPILIEPFRKDGNIDINRQNELAKQRLLVNLLKPESDIEYSLRKLRESKDFAFATKIKLTFDNLKIVQNEELNIVENLVYKSKDKSIHYDDIISLPEILETLFKKFEIKQDIKLDINKTIKEHSFSNKIKLYIVKKIITIIYRYDIYNKYKNLKNIDKLIEQLYNDNTHITYKLKRAIYFLKYRIFEQKEEFEFFIEECSNKIDNFLANNKDILYHQITPPSFYNIDIFLSDSKQKKFISFDTLSSGEKQRILFINGLIYHLENINSSDNQKYRYRYVNIILDEIELYYHPEYQREHVMYLLKSLEKANLDNIFGLNIVFITHSPFILTDIIDTNVLFLDKKIDDEYLQTFGANMFELFKKGFFVKDSIGNFSSEYIKAISLILSFFQALKIENAFLLRRLLYQWYEAKNEDLSQEKIQQEDTKFLANIKLNTIDYLQKAFMKNNLDYNRYKHLVDEEKVKLIDNFDKYIKIIGDEVIKKHFLSIYKDLNNANK